MFNLFFFFNDTATTEIYTLSLHDALPIFGSSSVGRAPLPTWHVESSSEIRNPLPSVRLSSGTTRLPTSSIDRKSTRLNSSHSQISYAVFCLKKKKKQRDKIFTYIFTFHMI